MLEHDWIDSSFRPGHDGVRVMPVARLANSYPQLTVTAHSTRQPRTTNAQREHTSRHPHSRPVLYLQALQPEPGHDELTPYPSAAARSRREQSGAVSTTQATSCWLIATPMAAAAWSAHAWARSREAGGAPAVRARRGPPGAVAVRGVPATREAAAPPLRHVGSRHGRH